MGTYGCLEKVLETHREVSRRGNDGDSDDISGGDKVSRDHNAPRMESGKTLNVRERRGKAERKEFTPKIKCFLCDGPQWA